MRISLATISALSIGLVGCSSMGEYANHSSTNEKAAAQAVANLASGSTSVSQLSKIALDKTAANIASTAAAAVDGAISNSRTEFSLTDVSKGGKSRFEIVNVTGLELAPDGRKQSFLQSSLHNTGNRATLNVGYGQRFLSENEEWLTGMNMFLDYSRYGHQRVSLGGEVRSSAFELNANKYFGLTDWRTGKNGSQEKALSGYDVELGMQIPYVPSTKFYVKQFMWDRIDTADVKGKTYSLEFAHMFGSGISLALGQRNYAGADTDDTFAKVTYRIPLGNVAAKTSSNDVISKRMFENESMKSKMLDKVRRNNAMVVQTKFTAEVGGV